MMAVHSGSRRHRIRFEREVVCENDAGELENNGWVTVVEVMARRTNNLRVTAEGNSDGATTYREQVRWDIRPRHIDPSWRILEVSTGMAYDIKSAGTSNDGSETAVITLSAVNKPGCDC